MVLYRQPGLSYRASNTPYRGIVPVANVIDFTSKPQTIVTDRQGQFIVELDKAVIDHITWELNGVGECVFKNPIMDPKISTYPRGLKDEIQIRVDGKILWTGLTWRENLSYDSVEFTAQNLLSYFFKRFVTNTSLVYENVEQMLIAWKLVEYAQAGTNKDLNISLGDFNPSGHKRYRKYDREDHAMIYDLLQDFPKVDDGFDFEIVSSEDGLQRYFTPYYPEKGTLLSNIVIEIGKNLQQFSLGVDYADLATHIYETGGTEADVKFEANYEDTEASAYYGEMQAIESQGNELDPDWLLAKATQSVKKRRYPSKKPELTTSNFKNRLPSITAPVALLNRISVGDYIPIKIDRGRAQLLDVFRITSIRWNPQADNIQVVVE